MKRGLLLSVVFMYALFLSMNAVAQDFPETQEVTVSKVGDAAITIDGFADEEVWGMIDANGVPYVACGGTNDAYPDASDHSATWKVAWSMLGWYLFAEVKDDALVEWVPDGDQPNYQVDNCETFFYIPPDWGDTKSEDGAWVTEASQIRFTPELEETITGRHMDVWDAPEMVELIEYAFNVTSDGWTVEAFYPWELFAVKPDDLMDDVRKIGWEIAIADSDEYETGREYCLVWNQSTENDLAWNNINYMGDATLENTPTLSINPNAAQKVEFYVANNVLYIAESLIGQELTIMNLAGQDIFNTEITSAKMNLNDLNQGLYLVKIGEEVRKVMILK